MAYCIPSRALIFSRDTVPFSLRAFSAAFTSARSSRAFNQFQVFHRHDGQHLLAAPLQDDPLAAVGDAVNHFGQISPNVGNANFDHGFCSR